MKAWLHKIVSRRTLEFSDPIVVSVRAKAPRANGAVIFLHKGLGDLLVALPALLSLRALGPIDLFLANDRFSDILENYGIGKSNIYPYGRLRTWLAVLRGKYDYCVNFDTVPGTPSCYPSRLLMILASAKLNVGYTLAPVQGLIQISPLEPAEKLFMGEVFNNLARCLGGSPDPIAQAPRRRSEGPIVLHVGGRLDGSGFDKRWPIQKYVELAERCAELGRRVEILWGPGDPTPKATAPVRVKYCSRTESLIETISEARLFICNNTGVLWVANLVGVETISFATPFFLPLWDPRKYRSETNHVLFGDPFCGCVHYRCKRGNCIHEIGVETVFQFVKERLR